MGLLWILFYLFFAFAPILCMLYVIKGKKIWLFNLITILVTAALVGYDFFAAYNAEDFHTAAFIFQLFLPIQVASAILTFVIGNLILLKKRGFFTKKRLKKIGITLVALLVLVGFSAIVRGLITVANYKVLPDIAYTAVNLQFNDDGFGVIFSGADNKYKEVRLDESLVSLLQKNEYPNEYEKCFSGTQYEGCFVRRALVDQDSKKVYMITGGSGGDSYYKLFCYDKGSNSLDLIVDGDSWIYDFDLSDDGSYLVYEIDNTLLRYDLSSGETTVITDKIKQKKKAAADEKLVRVSKDGRFIIYFCGLDGLIPIKKYIFIYDVEKDEFQKVPVKKARSVHNVDWYEE